MKGTANTNNYKPHFHTEIKSLKADLYIKIPLVCRMKLRLNLFHYMSFIFSNY